jgi:pyruvate dehydrogenase (quinone)
VGRSSGRTVGRDVTARKEHEDLHNNDLNQVTWEMRAMEDAPKFTESQQLPDVAYEGCAQSLGLDGIAVDKPDQVGPAWDRAVAAGRPTVLDVRTDPDIPPHATFEQARTRPWPC